MERLLVLAAHPLETKYFPDDIDLVLTGVGMSAAAVRTTEAVLARCPDPARRADPGRRARARAAAAFDADLMARRTSAVLASATGVPPTGPGKGQERES